MKLRRLTDPFLFTTAIFVAGFFLFGGPWYLWAIGGWLANVPVTFAWNVYFAARNRGERRRN